MNNSHFSKLTFEQSMKRLEKIIDDLENGNVQLENAVSLYSEGIQLQDHCKNKLENAKLKINKIAKGKDKVVITQINNVKEI